MTEQKPPKDLAEAAKLIGAKIEEFYARFPPLLDHAKEMKAKDTKGADERMFSDIDEIMHYERRQAEWIAMYELIVGKPWTGLRIPEYREYKDVMK